jgi:putative phosphoesterase
VEEEEEYPMRRVAVLNDVHGNLPALEAVLAELDREPVDAIVCGGDLLWGAYQSECLALLRARDARFLTGNCERQVLGEIDESHAWCAGRLSEVERAFVGRWPATVELEIDGLGRVLFCHGSPRSDEEILTMLTPEAAASEGLAGVTADVVVIGHTHQQFDRPVGAMRLVNAGSVGLPYEGHAGAFWALLGPDVEFRGTIYDLAAAAESLRTSGMPGIEDLLGDSLLEPAPRDEVTAYFEQQRARVESGSS